MITTCSLLRGYKLRASRGVPHPQRVTRKTGNEFGHSAAEGGKCSAVRRESNCRYIANCYGDAYKTPPGACSATSQGERLPTAGRDRFALA